MTSWLRSLFEAAVACLAIGVQASLAADVAGSQDNPQVGRYEGSEITFYTQFALDEAALLQGPLDLQNRQSTSGAGWVRAEGRVTRIRYTMPAHRSSFEVLRNFEASLKAKGFQIVFICQDVACLSPGAAQPDVHVLGEVLDPRSSNPMMYYDHSRYLLAKRDQPAGPTYVSLIVGERLEQSVAFLQVVEPQQAEEPKKVVGCPQFVGMWRNVDPNTRSLSRVEVTGSCESGKLALQVWGACHPTECNWGVIPAQYDAAKREISATTTVSFEVTKLFVTLDEAGKLVVKSFTHFTDKSGRPDMAETDVLQR